MTGFTGCWKLRCNVIWIGCRIVIRQVTADTGRRNSTIAVCVALHTRYTNMGTCQWERSGCVVIK